MIELISVFKKIIVSIITSSMLLSVAPTVVHARINFADVTEPKIAKQIRFDHIMTSNGLSNSTVNSIIQDKRGFMWFATGNGVDKYDGYNFIHYRSNPSDKTSLSSAYTNVIFEDTDGVLWIGTSNGLNRFNRITDNFTQFRQNASNSNSLVGNYITSICEDNTGILWVGTPDGLTSYNKTTGHFTQYTTNNGKNLIDNYINALSMDTDNNLWILTDKGLTMLNSSRTKFSNYSNKMISDSEYNNIYIDETQTLWLGTTKGLIQFNLKTKTFQTSYKHNPADSTSISNDNVTYLLDGASGSNQLLIGTEEGGLNILDKLTGKFTHFKHDDFDENSISGNGVYCLYKDSSGLIWIGTYKAGINKVKEIQILHYKKNPTDKNSLSDNIVHAVYEDNNRFLWVGTEGGGLDIFDRTNNTKLNYNTNSSILCNNGVWAIHEDCYGDIWIGTSDGMNKLLHNSTSTMSTPSSLQALKSRKLTTVRALNEKFITAITEDNQRNLWISTLDHGLYKYNIKTKSFKNFIPKEGDSNSIFSKELWSLYFDKETDKLWIGSEECGVDVLDINTEIFEHKFVDPTKSKSRLANNYKTKPYIPNLALSIFKDHSGIFWIGTWGYGLFRYSPKKDLLENYSVKDVLTNDIILGIQEDQSQNLWLSTDKGIKKLYPSVDSTKAKVEIFDEGDGVQNNEFNIGAYCKTKSGELVFGGINGFNIVNPNTLSTESNFMPIRLTEFWESDTPLQLSKYQDSTTPIEDISDIRKIYLNYNDKSISFEFASLGYTNPSNNLKYKYKLKGYDDEWITTNNNFVNYQHLPSGKYTFLVRHDKDNTEISDSELSIQINMPAPPWKSWWAISMYFLVSIFVIYFVAKFYIKRQAQKIENQLHTFADSLTSTLDLNEVYERFFENFNKISEYDCGLVYELNDIDSSLQIEYIKGRTIEEMPPACVDGLYSVAMAAIESFEPIIINDTSKDGRFQLKPIHKTVRSLLCIPIIYSGNTKGVTMFYSKSPSSFIKKYGFAVTYATQASISMENARLFNDLNKSSEDIRNLLDHTGQGFLSFSRDLRIHNEYSLECIKIFGFDIKDKLITELLCDDEEKCNFFKQTIDKIFSNQISHSKQKIYMTLLPSEITINGKTIESSFRLLKSSNKHYDTVMVVLTDITERRTLEMEMSKEQETMKMVVRVITHFNDFVEILKEYNSFCTLKINEIFGMNNTVDNILTEIYLEIHTFKGNFSQLNMLQTTSKLHDFENLLSDMKKNSNYYTKETLSSILKSHSLESFSNYDVDLLKSILGDSIISASNMVSIDVGKLIEIESRIALLYPKHKANSLIEEIKLYRCKSLKDMLYGYVEYSLKLSEKLEKMVNIPIIEGEEILVVPEKYFSFTRSLVHIFRNAIDHGIEFEDERVEAGKEIFGNIICSVERVDNDIIISITDDGRGLDIERIKERARSLELFTDQELDNMQKPDIYNILFLPEFSTRNVITDISGRGIGLSAVYTEVEKLGGKIETTSQLGCGTTFRIILPT